MFSIPLLFFLPPSPPLLLPSSERRQVGIRAAVNSPAPLSALMSLLLFALLNAIRAYSVSLPPPPSPYFSSLLATTSSFRLLSQTSGGSRKDARARDAHTRDSSPRLFRAHRIRSGYTRTCTHRAIVRVT